MPDIQKPILDKIFKGRKILILGFAREGMSSYRFLRRHYPSTNIVIADKKDYSNWEKASCDLVKKDTNLSVQTGRDYLKTLKDCDVVIKSPGITNKLEEIVEAKKAGVEFTSQTKLFFELCLGPVIGVTGTKGKSTTSSLIYHILKNANIPAVMLGNIGLPPLDHLDEGDKNTWYVFELSSHQLSDIEKSPYIAVLLNIYKEHLDYYEYFNQYLAAKENVTFYQKPEDIFIYNADVPEFDDIAARTKAEKLTFAQTNINKANCYPMGLSIMLSEGELKEKVVDIADIPIIGAHNISNAMAATLASHAAGATVVDITKAIKTFKPLNSRLEVVGTFAGILFVCDTLATIPEATVAAIEAYSGTVGTLICGGYDRGQEFSILAEKVIAEKIENLALFPTTGKKILQEIKKLSRDWMPNILSTDNMKEAVAFAYNYTTAGKVCLLSAGSSSFSLFENYEDEANQFKENVLKLADKKISIN